MTVTMLKIWTMLFMVKQLGKDEFLWVHIADVSYYVKETLFDKDSERGTVSIW
ncbi:MAG: hypothetical protein ACLR2G_00790 [Phascolarctobacterium faecium]